MSFCSTTQLREEQKLKFIHRRRINRKVTLQIEGAKSFAHDFPIFDHVIQLALSLSCTMSVIQNIYNQILTINLSVPIGIYDLKILLNFHFSFSPIAILQYFGPLSAASTVVMAFLRIGSCSN